MLAAQGFGSIPLHHHDEIDGIGQNLPLLTIDSTRVDRLCWQGEDPTPYNRMVVHRSLF